MKTSTDTRTRLDEAPQSHLVATLIAPVALPWDGHAGSEAAGDRPLPAIPDHFALQRMARAERAKLMGELIARATGTARQALIAFVALVRRLADRHRQHREARAREALWRRLDRRTLRDLGLRRSELTGASLPDVDAGSSGAVRHALTCYASPRWTKPCQT
jgi:uncharacterized protein YjiS (DUF1127 family)